MKRGDWVVNGFGLDQPHFGMVKNVWDAGKEKTVDVVYYDPNGNKVGRVSLALDGPTTYEPALNYEDLTVIKEPTFPLIRTFSGGYGSQLMRKKS